tara:strand:- start:39158 stop:40129 length:972 start_codon:yes stop_codon:yes gene_type:complete
MPPSVTMELCGELEIDDVQEAIAIEYQNAGDEKTNVMVSCEGATATVRVIGPSHPRGRIIDVDLSGVDSVALPRTIALLAAELWTAPEPQAAQKLGISDDAAGTRKGPRTPRRLYTIGVGLQNVHRHIEAGRQEGPSFASGNYEALVLRAEVPLFPSFGVFASHRRSRQQELRGHERLEKPTRWMRTEVGGYIPFYKSRLRIDLRFSMGTDRVVADDSFATYISMAVVPDYSFKSAGFDAKYAIDAKFTAATWLTVISTNNDDQEFGSPKGSRWGVGLAYEVLPGWILDGTMESTMLTENRNLKGRNYQDSSASVELGLQYRY